MGSGGIQIVYLKLLTSLSAACFLLSLLGDKSKVPLCPAELWELWTSLSTAKMENGFYSWAPGKSLHNCNSVLVFPSWAGSQPCEKVSALCPAPHWGQGPRDESDTVSSVRELRVRWGQRGGIRLPLLLSTVSCLPSEFLTVGCPMWLTLTQRTTRDLSWVQQLNMVWKYLPYSILFVIKILFNFCPGGVVQLVGRCPVHQKVACSIPS